MYGETGNTLNDLTKGYPSHAQAVQYARSLATNPLAVGCEIIDKQGKVLDRYGRASIVPKKSFSQP